MELPYYILSASVFGKHLSPRAVALNKWSGLITLNKIKGKCLFNPETSATLEETSRWWGQKDGQQGSEVKLSDNLEEFDF